LQENEKQYNKEENCMNENRTETKSMTKTFGQFNTLYFYAKLWFIYILE